MGDTKTTTRLLNITGLRVEFKTPPNTMQVISVQRQYLQPITWLTNKTVEQNTQTKYNSQKQTTQNTTKHDTQPVNEIGLYNTSEPTSMTLTWLCPGEYPVHE